MSTTRNWTCMCGAFEAQVTGDAALAVWCHCLTCRQATGAAMQLGVWAPDNFKIIKGGDDGLIKYSKTANVFRNACKSCGSFCYKQLPDGNLACPLGALEPVVKPSCHIMVAHKGEQDVMFPELPQHQEWP